ncbi:hypothetical protein PBRA_004015 [Plasmodiophora brassicae]|uniref:Sphingomyelin synthase-like domain-containing protein n=1 Tax=Plasmodiophora brassicae TaxID=37360 RepID=A0A0G4IJA3_PLABS|nr:hypothetical protein PBRA_004015 [Plasmodiophora brassicae]
MRSLLLGDDPRASHEASYEPLLSLTPERQRSTFRQNCLAVGALFAGAYVDAVMQSWIDRLHDRHRDLLPDMGIDALSSFAHLSHDLPDVLLVSVTILSLVRVLLHRRRVTLLRRYAVLQGLILFLRSMTISVTRLPGPRGPSCRNVMPADLNPLLGGVLVLTRQILTCGDVMFSGHTSAMVLWALITNSADRRAGDHLPSRLKSPIRIAIWALVWCGAFVIIATRFHYTVDVIVAVMLTCSMVWLYTALVQIGVYRTKVEIDDDRLEAGGFGRVVALVSWLERE